MRFGKFIFEPIHWTETDFPLLGGVTVDGMQYRFIGLSGVSWTAVQHLMDVQPPVLSMILPVVLWI